MKLQTPSLATLAFIASPALAEDLSIPDFSECDQARNKITCINDQESVLIQQCTEKSEGTSVCLALTIATANRARQFVISERLAEIDKQSDFNTGLGIGAIIFSD